MKKDKMESLNTAPKQESNFHWALRRTVILSMAVKLQLKEEVYWNKLFLLYWMQAKLKDFIALQSSALDISDERTVNITECPLALIVK